MLADLIPKLAAMDQDERDYYPRPSAAGPERCIRQMVYHGLNYPREPLPGRALLVFDDSSWHEELTADVLRDSPYKLHSEQMEVDCGEKYGIRLKGHIDGIVTDPLRIDRLLEHKAINHFTFGRFWSGEIPLDYVAQTCLYILGLQNVNPDIVTALLLIKNKNTAQFMEYFIEMAPDDTARIVAKTNSQGETIEVNHVIENVTDECFKKFAQVRDYIQKKTLPKRQYDMDHWRCEYCQWSKPCWENYEAEFNELATDQELSDDLVTLIKYRQETGAQKGELEKEYKKLTNDIKEAMKGLNVRQGRAGEYLVEIRLVHRDGYVAEPSVYEQVAVSRRKGGAK